MMYKAKVIVSSESHTKHIMQGNQQAEFLNVNLVVRKVTGRL
jgi:hypothetical protein